MVTQPIHTATSGLIANQKLLRNSAHNIANARTPDSQVAVTEFSSTGTGGVKADTTFISAAEGSTFLNDVVNVKLSETNYKANAQVLKTADDMLGELLDIVG